MRVGYSTPENLKSYATYMETRIKAYANLKHDAIRVQSESNRDHRATTSTDTTKLDAWIGGDASGSKRRSGGISRSKTLAGRKLRQMSVEKGLLRETKIVQKMVSSLLQCKVRTMI
jgi:phosphatidylinositol-binding clathrin assembly protein